MTTWTARRLAALESLLLLVLWLLARLLAALSSFWLVFWLLMLWAFSSGR